MFKVWTRQPRTFATLQDAKDYAQTVFARTGAIVAITQETGNAR